jgi:hypothetical protein
MRQDDILLNNLYSKINKPKQIVNEGIMDWLTGKPRIQRENDLILAKLKEFEDAVKKSGMNPESFVDYDKIDYVLKNKKNETETQSKPSTPENWGGPSQYMNVPQQSGSPVKTEPKDDINDSKQTTKSVPSSSTPKPKIRNQQVDLDQWAKEQEQKKQREKPEYHVPDYLKNLKTNRMNKIQIMEFLDLDLEEFKFLQKYLPFEKGTIDASNLEGKNYLTIINLLDLRKKELETKKSVKPKSTSSKSKSITSPKKPTIKKKK